VANDDADLSPGIPLRLGVPVQWTYMVTNTGGVALNNVRVTDDRGVTVNCPGTSLAIGASMTCTASGTTISGLYRNVARAEAPEPCGGTVSDTDASHYNTPVLEFAMTGSYWFIWNDEGSGADLDGGFWRPRPANGYYFLGDYGQGNYGQPSRSVYTVRVREFDNPSDPVFKAPLSYVRIWDDSGSGADRDGSVWLPFPWPGYICSGHVFQSGYDGPNPSNSPGLGEYRCLRADLVTPVDPGGLIWDDQGSGADDDVSVYRIPRLDAIFAIGNYNQPTQKFYIPVGLP
jgi:hypothetical protein